MLTEQELTAIEARYWAARRDADEYWIEHIPALLVEVRRLQKENERVSGTCAWKYDDMYDYFECECGAAWSSDVDSRPAVHGIEYCQRCGRRVVVEMPEEERDDA